ncbi:MAG: hypothetical protein ACRDYF_07650 [Acidimicrobiia bacterium]
MSSRVIPFPAVAAVHGKSCVVTFPASLHDAVASSRRQHRSLIAAAGEWALARGLSLPADHVALWAANIDELGYASDVDGMTGPWRASALPDFLANVVDWCVVAGCALPAGFPESLWHLYGFLTNTGRLHPASDSLAELRASIVVFGTFDRFRPVPPEPTAA